MEAASRDFVVETVVRVLSPLVGGSMASAAARMNCEKLGFSSARLEGAQIDRLLEELAPGLRVFIGKRSTDDAIASIRDALSKAGGAR